MKSEPLRLSLTKHHHVAEDLLSSLLFGGAFHRHPNLTVVLEEMGVGWIPAYVDLCRRQSKSSTMMGDWPFELSGDELLRRNVRFTPLPSSEAFEAIYIAFLDRRVGPRAGSLLACLPRDFVLGRLSEIPTQ